jgi:two-component system chemotaxis response regulator CheY
MKAIIVDDSRAMRMLLKRLLASVGFNTLIEAAHGKEALDRLAEHGAFDLALVDWNMPEMNGIEFVIAVRSMAEYDAMRMMMVTTETETDQIVQALSAGANEYMMKPFTAEALREKLQILGLAGDSG